MRKIICLVSSAIFMAVLLGTTVFQNNLYMSYTYEDAADEYSTIKMGESIKGNILLSNNQMKLTTLGFYVSNNTGADEKIISLKLGEDKYYCSTEDCSDGIAKFEINHISFNSNDRENYVPIEIGYENSYEECLEVGTCNGEIALIKTYDILQLEKNELVAYYIFSFLLFFSLFQ